MMAVLVPMLARASWPRWMPVLRVVKVCGSSSRCSELSENAWEKDRSSPHITLRSLLPKSQTPRPCNPKT